MTSDDVLSRFVLRGRRIAAHSLVQDQAKLESHAGGSFEGTLDTSGKMTVIQRLPDDEEAFESLAARLRPLTVKSEPIYYVKVFTILESVESGDFRDRIAELRQAWTAAEIQGSQVQAFAVQQSKADGSEATDFVSDTQLAAAWLYADLVHADASGPKKAALALPLTERYAAAVRVFAHLARLTLATLELVEAMIEAGLVSVEPEARTREVVVGKKELVREARAYVAEVGATPPDLRVTQAWPEEWKPYTVTEMRRQNPANRVRVTMRGIDGSTLAVHDSAVIHRDSDAKPTEWHVLVAGCFVFKFGVEFDGAKLTGGRFDGIHELKGTNELALSATNLRLQMHEAAAVVFSVNDIDLFELSDFKLSPAELRQDEVLAEVLGDIVAVERVTGDLFDVCESRFTNTHRVSLRRARLLHEGKLIRANRGPLIATIDVERPPRAIRTPPSTLDVGGAKVPVPATVLWHPQMAAEFIETVDAHSSYTMSVPDGERFLEWAPERLNLLPDSNFSDITLYNLTGIDESEIV